MTFHFAQESQGRQKRGSGRKRGATADDGEQAKNALSRNEMERKVCKTAL